MKPERIKDAVFSSLDAIYKASEKIAETPGFKANEIPLSGYALIIDKAKWKKEGVDDEIAADYIDSYNSLLSSMIYAAHQHTKITGVNIVLLQFVKDSVQLIKDRFNEGMNESKIHEKGNG
jgi:hypothetical protein